MQLGSHPVAVVQYTFTPKQYIEQHNEQLWLEGCLGFKPRLVKLRLTMK